jgi:hypothetical protein
VVREKFIVPVELAGWSCAGSGKLMNFSEHVDGFCDAGIYQKTVIIEFRDPYTLRSLYTSLVRSKLEYVSCVI